MKITPLEIYGSYIIEREPYKDDRGYFARLYCEKEFKNAGIDMNIKQMNLCENKQKGTLRGMHYQSGSYAENKLVSCTRGKIFDVFVDLRVESPTYLKYNSYELSEENGKMLYIPEGCAHGYLTLSQDCQILYLMSEFYEPGHSAGYRYDDPSFNIKWPQTGNLIISEKDRKLPYIK
jgi:dTDP-4-dehydrorhamnose 3,5-epimerase